MHRQHYRSNFVQGETYQQRSTRSNAPPIQQNPTPSPAVIPIKTDPTPPQQPQIQQQAPIQQQQQPVPMKIDQTPISTPGASNNTSFSEDELSKLKKINFKKKVTGKEKRSKQNKKLFRMLTPRNAIAALNELHGQSINETTVVPVPGNKFEAEIVINNVKFTGVGSSKMSAKNNACEKALRDLVINKFKQIKTIEPLPELTEDVNMEEGESSGDVPMLQLASFALHKLFSEWESEGFEIPFPKINPEVAATTPQPTNGTEKQASPKAPKVRNELPPNNLQMHPVMLLSVMRPCTQYQDLGSQGVTPNIVHTVGCTVDGQSFIGQGRSKKEARKRVATEILIKLFEWKGSCC